MRAALRCGAIVLTVLLFLLAHRRPGERTGRLAERLETTGQANDVQRQRLEAGARRPRDRDRLAGRRRIARLSDRSGQACAAVAEYGAAEKARSIRTFGSPLAFVGT